MKNNKNLKYFRLPGVSSQIHTASTLTGVSSNNDPDFVDRRHQNTDKK